MTPTAPVSPQQKLTIRCRTQVELGLAAREEQKPDTPGLVQNIGSAPDGQQQPSTPESLPTVTLRRIIADLLAEAVEPLGLNVRQVKALSNTLKLYLEINGCKLEDDAVRLAAFLFADRVDPEWLDALFRGEDLKESTMGQLPRLPEHLKTKIGTDQKTMLSMYRLIGRRPRTTSSPVPEEMTAKT